MPDEINTNIPQPEAPRPGTPESETPTTGYFDGSGRAYGVPDRTQPTDQPPTNTPNELEELSKKLGIDPNTIGQPDAPEPPAPPMNTEDWYAKQFGSEEAKQFAENFKKFVGIDIKEVYGLINNTAQVTRGVEEWRQQVAAKQQLDTLKSELGSEFEDLMPHVLEKFRQIKQTNPRQAQALDNIDGAKMLAALIKQERSRGQQFVAPDVPNYFPNRRPVDHSNSGTGNFVKFTDFVKWSDSELQAKLPDIQSGRIKIIH